jgi:hypothetical protein
VKIVNKCCLQGTRQSTALWTSNRETLSRRPALPFSCTWYHFCFKNSFIVDIRDQTYVSMSYYFPLGKCCSALFYFYQKGVDVKRLIILNGMWPCEELGGDRVNCHWSYSWGSCRCSLTHSSPSCTLFSMVSTPAVSHWERNLL